jgi:hypothetical protein
MQIGVPRHKWWRGQEKDGGEGIQGAVTVFFGPQSWEIEEYPTIQEFRDKTNKYEPDAQINSVAFSAYALAQVMTSILVQTGPDLTRTAFLKSAEICKWDDAGVWTPKSLSTTDHDWNESEMSATATGTGDTFKWATFGDAVDWESTTDCTAPTLPWDAIKQPGSAPQAVTQ